MLVVRIAKPTTGTALGRGLRRRCGRCGARAPFNGWFRLGERCVRCGYRFAREEGFFTGVYLVNYTWTAALLVVELFAYLGYSVAQGTAPLGPWLALGFVLVVVVPALTYPFAATTWAALDLVLRPLDPHEEAEAALHEQRG